MGCLRLEYYDTFEPSKHYGIKTLTSKKSKKNVRSYQAFGMEMSGRKWQGTSDKYRYSHNSHEREDAIFEGAQSAEYWMYDSRIGRRWNIDPIVKEWESPYACFGNNPIAYSDINGADAEKPANPNGTDGGPKEGEKCTNPTLPGGGHETGETFTGGEWIKGGDNNGTIGGNLNDVVVTPPGSSEGSGSSSEGTFNSGLPKGAEEGDPRTVSFNAYMAGAANAIVSNNAFGMGYKNPANYSSNEVLNRLFAQGQLLGNSLTMVSSIGEMDIGSGMMVGGIAAAPAAGTGLVVAGVGAIITAHGSSAISLATASSIKASAYLAATGHHNGNSGNEEALDSGSQNINLESPYSSKPPDSEKMTKMKGNQGWKDKNGNTWKKDMKHKDHWDVSDRKGNKIKEVDFKGNQIWPGGPKNKNKT